MVREIKNSVIGDIPIDWQLQTFEETFQVLSNNTLPRSELNNSGGPIKNVHYGDILTHYTERLDCQRDEIPYINDLSLISSSTQLLQDGDVIIADTAEDETVGKVTEVFGLGVDRMVAGLHTIPCRVKKGDFASGWLGYYMNSHVYHDQIIPFITGIKVSSISKSVMAETLIAVPPKKEQKEIVQALSEIDELMFLEEKIVSKIRAIKSGCLSKMFPKSGETIPEMRLPGFAEAWEQRKLGDVCEFLNGDRSENYPASSDFQESGIPFIGSDALRDTEINMEKVRFISKGKYEVMKGIKIQEGDILYTLRGAGFGKNSLADFNGGTIASSLVGIRCDKENVVSIFLTQWFNSMEANREKKQAVNGSTAQNISVNDMKEYLISNPAIDEQKQIGAYFSTLDHLITLHQRKIEKYRKIKQGMMSELLTGKIRLV